MPQVETKGRSEDEGQRVSIAYRDARRAHEREEVMDDWEARRGDARRGEATRGDGRGYRRARKVV